MRLDQKLKYLAEIAARKQRRSLANFIEYALEKALAEVKLVGSGDFNRPDDRSVLDEAGKLWDLEPSDRLIKMVQNYPDLLTYEEQVIWKAICEIEGGGPYANLAGEPNPDYYDFFDGSGKKESPNRRAIRECWPKLVAYVNQEAKVEEVLEVLSEALEGQQVMADIYRLAPTYVRRPKADGSGYQLEQINKEAVFNTEITEGQWTQK